MVIPNITKEPLITDNMVSVIKVKENIRLGLDFPQPRKEVTIEIKVVIATEPIPLIISDDSVIRIDAEAAVLSKNFCVLVNINRKPM